MLARAGASPVLIDRDAEAGDALCGGFLSWQTAESLRQLGIDCAALGAQRIERLRLFVHGRQAEARLPAPAYALSRRRLDTALRESARACGVELAVDTIRAINGTTAVGQNREWHGTTLFLATGKHDVRGMSRPRHGSDPALGLRLRLPASPTRSALLSGAIELHLFEGGYAGIVLQEDGSANLCLAVRKSLLSAVAGDPALLLDHMRQASAPLAERMGDGWRELRIDTIGALPYGYICRETSPGLFRLGDQAAVIPSLAGEGIGMALASGLSAGRHWLEQGAAGTQPFQSQFARSAQGPVHMASLAWSFSESSLGRFMALNLCRLWPGLLARLMRRTRIAGPPSLAPSAIAAKTRPQSP